jgi:hypothetical protein
LKFMTQDEAIQYCASTRNAHLPTPRELAELAMSYGARGILEVDYVAEHGLPDYPLGAIWRIVDSKNLDGSVDRFYFSDAGFVLPPQLAKYGFVALWSSSLWLPSTEPPNVRALASNLVGGDFGWVWPDNIDPSGMKMPGVATRCVLR